VIIIIYYIYLLKIISISDHTVLRGAVISEKWIWNSVEGRDHATIWVIKQTLGQLAATKKWTDIHKICAEYKGKPSKEVVANFRLKTGDDCL